MTQDTDICVHNCRTSRCLPVHIMLHILLSHFLHTRVGPKFDRCLTLVEGSVQILELGKILAKYDMEL